MSDLVKAVYRNDDIKDDAYKIAEATMKLMSVPIMAKDDKALPEFCKTAAVAIIRDLTPAMVDNIKKTASARGMKISKTDLEKTLQTLGDLFIDEMESSGTVGVMDVKAWMKRGAALGATPEATVSALTNAWINNTPAIFKPFWDRLYRAIDGYINSSLQVAMMYAS